MKKSYLFILTLFFAASVAAQNRTTLSGVVTDTLMNGIANGVLQILNTSYETVTNNKGEYQFADLDTGRYELKVTAPGFAGKVIPITLAQPAAYLPVTLQKSFTVLDEVVVTAQKREEVLQNVPIAVSSLSAKQVQQYRLWNIEDLTAIAPNMYAANPGDNRNVTTIRGITTTSYDPAVATYIDGVNQFNMDTYIAQLFDVERIEILRGPQGTLYGRNAMGGVVNIITRQPVNKTSGFLEASIGTYGIQRYAGAFRHAVIKDKLFIGAAGIYDKRDGFYTNEFTGNSFENQHNTTGNYYIKYQPGKRWSATLNVKHSHNRNNGAFPLVFGISEALSTPFKLSQNASTQLVDNTTNVSLSLSKFGKHFTVTSQSAYQRNYRIYKTPIDADFSPIDGITLFNNYGKDWNKVQVITQEIKIMSPASQKSRLKWTTGAYLYHHNSPVKQATQFGSDATIVGAPDVNFSLINSTKSTGTGLALYGQTEFELAKNLQLTTGLRYDVEHKDQWIQGAYQKDPNPQPLFLFRTDTSAAATFNAFSPKATISYSAIPAHLLFAGYSRGFRTGGLTPLSSDPSQPALFVYQPEYSNNFEAGLKNTFFNNHLQFNVTAFYSSINNAQVPTLILPDAVTITRNTGKVNSRGIEVEAKSAINKLNVEYSGGYTHAAFSKYTVALGGTEVNLKGKRQVFTPNVTQFVAAWYQFALNKTNSAHLILRGEWRYTGKQYFDVSNTMEQPGYHLVNTKIDLQTKHIVFSIWGRNIFDNTYVAYAYDFGAAHLGDPATAGVTVRWDWQK